MKYIAHQSTLLFQENIEYIVVGDDIAPYYFRVDSVTGEVIVQNDLRTDTFNFDYDVSVSLTDQILYNEELYAS